MGYSVTETTIPKVVRVIARLNIGGPARHAAILHASLPGEGFESVLAHGALAADEGSFEDLLAERHLVSVRIPGLGRHIALVGDLVAFWAILRLIFAEQPDILHTHTAKAGTLGRLAGSIFNATRSRRRRCMLVHTFHGHVLSGYFGPLGSWIVRVVERSLARLTDLIVTISPRQRDEIVGRFRIAPARRVAMIPLGLDLDDLLEASGPSRALRDAACWTPDHFVVGFVGRLVPIKDVPLLLEAFATFAAGCPRARLLIVGDGDGRADAERRIQALRLSGAVQLAGWQSDLREVYGAINVLALTSRNEGTPVAIIEALAAGLPVVATDVGGVADVVQHEQTGLVVPAGDRAALAAALARLEADPALGDRLGARGRQDVKDRFSSRRLVRDIAAKYRSLLQERAGQVA